MDSFELFAKFSNFGPKYPWWCSCLSVRWLGLSKFWSFVALFSAASPWIPTDAYLYLPEAGLVVQYFWSCWVQSGWVRLDCSCYFCCKNVVFFQLPAGSLGLIKVLLILPPFCILKLSMIHSSTQRKTVNTTLEGLSTWLGTMFTSINPDLALLSCSTCISWNRGKSHVSLTYFQIQLPHNLEDSQPMTSYSICSSISTCHVSFKPNPAKAILIHLTHLPCVFRKI